MTISTSWTPIIIVSVWSTSSVRRKGQQGSSRTRLALALAVLCLGLMACEDAGVDGNGAAFPSLTPYYASDYLTTYTEVADCRGSEHGGFMRVHIFPTETAAFYIDRVARENQAFPEKTILVKSEYLNPDCLGAPTRITAMRKAAPGTAPLTADWQWQEFDFVDEFEQAGSGLSDCIGCHDGTLNVDCGTEWDYTCVILD